MFVYRSWHHEYINEQDKQNPWPYEPYILVSETDDKLVLVNKYSQIVISSLKK